MELALIFAPLVLGLMFMAYQAGKGVTECPTEDEMMERLIQTRVERDLRKITKENLNTEIDVETNNRLRQI